jgi:hypothetical protein
MSSPDHLAATVEAEEFAGGPMTLPVPSQMTKTGHVILVTKASGDWQADCTQCGAGCGVAGAPAVDDELDTDALDDEHRMLEDFTAEHRDCTVPSFGEDLPSPASMPAHTERGKTAWIVRGTNGQDIRVLAERHTTYARPEGTELRFYDGDGDGQHRVATVRAGSWHWVVEASALNPDGGEQ